MRDLLTYRYPRTLADAFGLDPAGAVAVQKFRKPLTKRFFYALLRWGWIAVPAVLALSVLTGCQSGETAVDRAVFAEASAAPREVAQAQRIERIAQMVEASP